MSYNPSFYGNQHNGVTDAPDLVGGGITGDLFSGNAIVFFKPTPNRKISLQALKSNVYNFSDNFINQSSEFISHSVRRGDTEGLNRLLTSAEAQNAVTINNDIESVIDLNRLNDYWKFILVLNKFGNKRMSGSGTSNTVIITGRCDNGEEPLIMNGSQVHYNPACELIIEGKTVFQSYDFDFRKQTNEKKHTTKSSTGYSYGPLIDAATNNETLFENKPGSMNFSAGLVDNGNGNAIGITTEPVHEVGQHGVSTFDRKQMLPGYTLKNTFSAISKTFRDKDQKTISGVLDYETDIPGMMLADNSVDTTTLIENIRNEENRNSLWTMDQLGPSVKDRLLATALESEYGVTEVKVLNGEACEYWQGSNQLITSDVDMWETIAEKAITTYMAAHQIHSINCEFAVVSNTIGEMEIHGDVKHTTSSVFGMSDEALRQRFIIFKDILANGLFRQMFDQRGDFTINLRINLTSTSGLAINFLMDGPPDDHVREFFPSEFAYTNPMIAKKETVANNQKALGHFLSRVCDDQTHFDTNQFIGNEPVNDSAYWNRQSAPLPPVDQQYTQPNFDNFNPFIVR